MDNEAPKYASWVPEAGGYVANGKVVSKSPMYDEAGKLRLDVDTSVFGNTQTPSTSKAQPQVANQATSNVGVTTANVTGSGTDANAQATGIGSLNSMSQNTQNAVDSALSSPAMRSPSAGEPILTIEQQDLKEIQDAHARNDIQGEINGYVKLARDTGVDYTQTIQDLTRQRQNKIEGIDDQYIQRINEAQQRANNAKGMYEATGDNSYLSEYYQALTDLNTLQSEQGTWRNAVGYEGAMRSKYQQEMDDVDLDFQDTWRNAIDDITNQIIQAYPAILNFQYNPNTDRDLMMAQSMVEARMRNSMSQTGMYYSSTTQYAIAQAIGELIPVYEKMAREEMIENFQLLQSTASFLMDLEQTQFNMWKSQIQLKWDEANQKQKEIQNAINNANARGYYTNEEAAKVGVAPGTESQAARERALDKQEQIEKELRNLQQSEALAEFKAGLEADLAEEKARIAAKYTVSSRNGGTNNTGDDTDDAGLPDDLVPEDGEVFDENYLRDYFINTIANATPDEQVDMIEDLADEYLLPLINEQSKNFGKSYGNTKKALETINAKIKQFAEWSKLAGISDEVLAYGITKNKKGEEVVVDGPIVRAVQQAMDQIDYASDDMDFVWGDFFTDNTKSKGNAKAYLANQLANSGNSALVLSSKRYSNYLKSDAKPTPEKTLTEKGFEATGKTTASLINKLINSSKEASEKTPSTSDTKGQEIKEKAKIIGETVASWFKPRMI